MKRCPMCGKLIRKLNKIYCCEKRRREYRRIKSQQDKGCGQIFCRWNDSSDGCVIPQGEICPMSNTEPDYSGAGQANEKRQEETYRKTCPFCRREHEQSLWLNIICPCGAKYYYPQKTWLDRNTGERVVADGK